MKILVVEDEPKTGQYLKQGLVEAGFVVDRVANGLDGLHLGTTEHLDIKLRFIKNIIEAQPDGEKAVIDAQDYTTIRYKKKNE